MEAEERCPPSTFLDEGKIWLEEEAYECKNLPRRLKAECLKGLTIIVVSY